MSGQRPASARSRRRARSARARSSVWDNSEPLPEEEIGGDNPALDTRNTGIEGYQVNTKSGPVSKRSAEKEDEARDEKDETVEPPSGCCAAFLKGFGSLWATRQTIDPDDNDSKVLTTLRELIVYVIFLVVLSVVALGMLTPTMYYYTTVMGSLFMDNNLKGSTNTFKSISGRSDIWAFAEGPLMNGLYWEKWYNGQNMTEEVYGYIYYESKLLGVPRIRQLRVRNDSCEVYGEFKTIISSCYDEYNEDSESRDNFGLGLTNNTVNTIPQAWKYNTEKELGGSGHSGILSSYPGGGYIQTLGTTRARSEQIIQELKDNLWLDRGTRAVFFDFTIYNGNVNLFCVIRLLVELPSTGGAQSSWNIRTVKLLRYVTGKDYFVMACECLFALFIIYYSIEEAIEIKKHKLEYFKDPWNMQDIILLFISVVCMSFNVYRTMSVTEQLDEMLEDRQSFPDFEFLSYWEVQFSTALALLVFLAWVKMFKYVNFNKSMNQLSETLSRCTADLAGFSVMFFVVFFAFCQFTYLVLGGKLEDYRTFTSCIFTLFRIMLGDFNFGDLRSADRIFGPLFFLTYIFFMFFILLNMFLAIIADAYTEMKEDMANQRNDIELGEYFKESYDSVMSKLSLKRDKILEIQEAMVKADENGDNQLDFDEWRNEMKNRGYAEEEIEAVFAKYDIDGDRVLNAEEQQAMMDDLSKDKEECEEELGDMEEKGEGDSGIERSEVNIVSDVPRDEFDGLSGRVSRMESSISSIASKIDAVLMKLAAIQKSKTKRQEALRRIIDDLNQASGSEVEAKRGKMRKLIREEMERLDAELVIGERSSAWAAPHVDK